MDNDQLYKWACDWFKKFDGNIDRQEKYAEIMAVCMQTRVLSGLSLQVQKHLAAGSHEG
jgi:hypothetical protein